MTEGQFKTLVRQYESISMQVNSLANLFLRFQESQSEAWHSFLRADELAEALAVIPVPNHRHNPNHLGVGEVDCQQETPQSEVSSVPKIGIVGKPLQLPSVSLDFKQGLFRLTVATGEYSRSTSFTWDEWVAIQQLFSTPLPTCGSLTTFGESKAGDRGPAPRTEYICPWCRAERADYEGPGAYLARCPNCSSSAEPVASDPSASAGSEE